MKFDNKVMMTALLLIVGSFLEAFAYAAFCAPNQIVPGGVYGLTIAINHVTKGLWGFQDGLPIGTTALFFNVPLFLLAWKKLGLKSGGKTIATFLMIAFFSDLISRYLGDSELIKSVQKDQLLGAFYGGAILGIGVFMVFKAGGTSAGTDVLARVITKGTNMKLSNMIIVIDSTVVLVGLLAFKDWMVPLYSWLTIIVYGQVVGLLSPENPKRAVFIVAKDPRSLKDTINTKLGMRATYLHGEGMYAGVNREVIFMIVERKDVAKLKKAVLAIDPTAFISTTNAAQDQNIEA
ncbi:YitT family protein [Falsiporphyromonas endometrii]|uniref:YitT family protein n=1 Tax=Falsiporphyromonas endometrii TaxID=1387297 RepID=A0ABV9K8A6_9PORP